MGESDRELTIFKSRYKDVRERDIDHFIGLCDMAVADGIIHQKEAELLLDYITSRPNIRFREPVKSVYNKLIKMVDVKHIDMTEERDLFELLSKIVAHNKNGSYCVQKPCELFFDDPQPEVIFEGNEFCLSGTFNTAKKALIADTLVSLNAIVSESLRKRSTKYLVVGSKSSDQWKHVNFGNKISQAMEMKEEGIDIKIISEEHLLQEISRQATDNN